MGRGGSGQDPSCLSAQWLAPGRGGGLGPAAQFPSPLIELQMGQASGTALPSRTLTRRHTGTRSYHDVKIKGGREKKKISSVCCWGPRNTGWGLCPRQGSFGIRGEQQGGWWLQGGGHPEIIYKGGGCPRSAPSRAELARGGGVHVGRAALLGVSPPDPLLRRPRRARGWE